MKEPILLALPIMLSLSHLVGSSLTFKKERDKALVQSFSAGFSVAYVFLILMPEIYDLSSQGRIIFLMIMVLLGFSFFHLLLKYGRAKLQDINKIFWSEVVHIVSIGVFSFVVSYSLVELAAQSLAEGVVLFLMVMVHVVLSELSINKHLENKGILRFRKMFLVGATMLGGILSLLGISNPLIASTLYALASGSIIYIAIREEIPSSNKGKPWLFLAGVFTLMAVVLLLQG